MNKLLIILGSIAGTCLYVFLMYRHLNKKENKPCKCETKRKFL